MRIAQIYRELHQMDKAEENLVKARQYSPGSLEVMYNEAMLYEAQGAIRRCHSRACPTPSPAVKGQIDGACRRGAVRLPILYQQLGQLYRDTQNYPAAVYTYEELGRLGDEEDRRARLLMMDTYRAAKDLAEGFAGRKRSGREISERSGRPSRATRCCLAKADQTDEAVESCCTRS